uniref:Uncharacterized protein n=1 Tax=Acrobeloides nanus TaxID=290746 RepID=A0A914CEQ5_9BILA
MFPGPKCSGCMAAISLWGIIFMAIVGGLFWNHSVGLIDDLPGETDNDILECYKRHAANDPDKDIDGLHCWAERAKKIEKLYEQNAKNCWIASGAFVVVFIFSVIKFRISIS